MLWHYHYHSLKDNEISNDFEKNDFLKTLKMVITQKWHIKITLLIDTYFSKEFIALIDSGADLNVINEGLIPTRYFQKTTHTLSHAGRQKLDISYKLPKGLICTDKQCIPLSFLLVKNISNQVILGQPFINKIYPFTRIDKEGMTATYKGNPITFKFVSKPFTKMINEIYNNLLNK